MPRCELNFLPDVVMGEQPTDEQLLLQLVYGLADGISNAKEEKNPSFSNHEGIPNPCVRQLMRAIVTRCNLPIPLERVDEWVGWRRSNFGWIFSAEDNAEADRLASLT